MKSNRQIVINFLNSPLHKKIELAKKTNLFEDGLSSLSDVDMFKLLVKKAKQNNTLEQFMVEVDKMKED